MKFLPADIGLTVVIFAALSVGLSIAFISVAKVALLVAAVVVLLQGMRARSAGISVHDLWMPRLVLATLFTFACSMLWTSASLVQALGAWAKYGKLLVIPALMIVIRTPRDAVSAMFGLMAAQTFLLLSSWLQYFDVSVIWATSVSAKTSFAVFSSYLDQGIMSAVVAAIFWHLKELTFSRPLYYLAMTLSLLALSNVFIVFVGRTGHVVGVAMVSLAVFWSLPRRYRLVALIVPPLLFFLVFHVFDGVRIRFSALTSDVSAYYSGIGAATSADNRLDMWKGSLDAIAEKPLTGYGVGSWATEYNRIQKFQFPAHADLGIGSNPHQEYLLWGVQLGIGGIVLLLALMAAMALDFLKMDRPVARAGLSVLLALALSCLFNSSLYDAYIGDFFCVSLGVLLAYGRQCRRDSLPAAPG